MMQPHAVVARSILLVAFVGAALTACSSDDSSSGSTLSSGDVTGQWVESDSDPVVKLELKDDGSVSGSDGCNQLNGTWTIDGSDIKFGAFAATMMACADVDTWLSGASTATVDGDAMTVLGDSGKEIGTLDKQS
ncbi:META domain-containing protein [Cellulomonas sp. URHE0023]|uniref:META domain-containing protein n=1 Tax=Cellulomonas sp. URHE0023 TaxID=1380354 RepID=UPI00068D5CC8|nr:META domain-containing protein [Cellulomonas sp. URHE0023]